MRTAGIVILIIGLVLTIFTSIQFFTKKEIVDVGPIEITKDEPHNIEWSPFIGIAVMGLGGALLLWKGSKK